MRGFNSFIEKILEDEDISKQDLNKIISAMNELGFKKVNSYATEFRGKPEWSVESLPSKQSILSYLSVCKGLMESIDDIYEIRCKLTNTSFSPSYYGFFKISRNFDTNRLYVDKDHIDSLTTPPLEEKSRVQRHKYTYDEPFYIEFMYSYAKNRSNTNYSENQSALFEIEDLVNEYCESKFPSEMKSFVESLGIFEHTYELESSQLSNLKVTSIDFNPHAQYSKYSGLVLYSLLLFNVKGIYHRKDRDQSYKGGFGYGYLEDMVDETGKTGAKDEQKIRNKMISSLQSFLESKGKSVVITPDGAVNYVISLPSSEVKD